MNSCISHCPTITVPCETRGKHITHALLIMYPRTLFIQYGKFRSDIFDAVSCEVLPFVLHPELEALHNGERWVIDEVHSMFDLSDEPDFAQVG